MDEWETAGRFLNKLCASPVTGAEGNTELTAWQRSSHLRTTAAQTLPEESVLEKASQGLGSKGCMGTDRDQTSN